MLFRKMWRTVGLYKAQFISMIVMIALGTGIFIGFNMEWVSLEKNVKSFLEATDFADYRIVSESGFTEEDLEKVSALDGVDKASRFISFNADVKEKPGDSLSVAVTEDLGVSGFMLMNGGEYDPESLDGVWLSDSYAQNNGISVGDSLTLSYGAHELSGRVTGLIKSGEYLICVRDETQLMPDYDSFGFAYISPEMLKAALDGEFYPQINIISQQDKKEFSDAVDGAFGKTMMILSKDENISWSGAMGETEEGKTMSTVLPTLFLLIAVLTMVTTMHRLAAQEKTQIGTLKALGFKNRKILLHYTSYAFFIGLIGAAAGVGIGFLVAGFIMNPDGSMGTYLDMPQWKLYLPQFCWLALAAMLALLTLIGFLSVRYMLKGTAADALRPYAPKKIKPLALERTGLWKELGFGTKWNLRDLMRHKTRALMSLIGVLGCMLIMVASLGMRDTMTAFLDMYYSDATNYRSRIYLSENADAAARQAVIDRYDGDYSASLGVQLGEKAVSLDIYSVENDKVRFPADDGGYAELDNYGAYVCMRIADEFGLSKGDIITLSPYGSDKEYSVIVYGVIRSVSESIVMSTSCADVRGIPYIADSVYTDAGKSDIAADAAIKSVQSKQSIIDSFDTFMKIMNQMILLLIAAAVILGVVVLYNLGIMSYAERHREMATLKVVGFRDRKIARLLISQNLWITLLGVILGMPAGAITLNVLMKLMASEYEMQTVIGPMTYIISVLLTFGVSFAVSLMVARKNKQIDMVEALKGAE